MRLKYQIGLLLLLTLLLGTGCNKWLDVKPKTMVNEDNLLNDEQGFKDALIGTYTAISNTTLYGKEFTMGTMDVFSGNYFVAQNTSTFFQAGLYNYNDATVKGTINKFWTDGYAAIANLNNLLSAIDSRKDIFRQQNYNIIKGEALGLRALLHFDLLRAFGPIPVGGLDKRAIPYRKTFNMNITPPLTMKEVIDACLKDLEEARSLLTVYQDVFWGMEDLFLSHTRNHLNYWAATGLMARIYLYKGDLPNAYKMAKAVIDGGKFKMIESSAINSIYPNRIFSTEHLFAVYVSNMEAINAGLFKSSAGSSVLNNKNTFINDLFEIANGGSTDYRYLFLWKTEGSSATKYPAKYWYDGLENANGNSYRRVPVLRYSEMYYIAAEATADIQEKISLLNAVRSHRGLSALSATLTADIVNQEIFKEYRKEFYQEGQLFFYYKRKNATKMEGTGIAGSPAVYVFPQPDEEIEFNH